MERSAPWNGAHQGTDGAALWASLEATLIEHNLVFFCVAVVSERELKVQLCPAATFFYLKDADLKDMGKYITTAFLREHSRIDADDASEEYLEQCIATAEAALAKDLQVESLKSVETLTDSDVLDQYGDPIPTGSGKLPGDLQRALLMLAATAYENRETESPTQLHPDPFYWHLVRRHVKYS